MKTDYSKLVHVALVAAVPIIVACALTDHDGVDARIVRTALRTDALGCWVLFDEAGRSAQGSLYWAPAVASLRATHDSSAGATGAYLMIKLDSTGREMRSDERRGWSYWSADLLSDSIRIGAHSGFSGTEFIFALPPGGRKRDTLRGRAYEHWDYKANTNRGRATAVRTRCPSPS